jgi:hypothetical protein
MDQLANKLYFQWFFNVTICFTSNDRGGVEISPKSGEANYFVVVFY